MSCQEYQRQIVLSLYEELNDVERAGLETHLTECTGCRQAFEEHQVFSSALADDKAAWELPSDLLVESRRALADELDRIETKRSWWRMPAFSVVFTPMRLLESAALVAMGLALGVYVSNQQARQVAPPAGQVAETPAIPQNGTISNLQVVNADSSTGQVELAGEVSQPLRFKGRV